MFKGLKSKIEDEAKRFQATVSHYSENIAQQVRSSASDAGSEISGHARRFFSSPVPDSSSNSKNIDDISSEKELPSESDLPLEREDLQYDSRRRHDSSDSVRSNESTLSDLFSTIPGMVSSSRRTEILSSDVEGESIAGSAFYQNASKEQISSVLHKLQGRAATYKDKYRELVKVYNELVRDNEKYKNVLAATQDKTIKRLNLLKTEKNALIEKLKKIEEQMQKERSKVKEISLQTDIAKIKKLEDLLEKCKLSIGEYKERNLQLNEENNKLRAAFEGASDEQGISDLAMQRINAEWKGKVDAVEAECSKKMRDTEEKATLLVAQVKADMHAALEEKENEVQALRVKYKQLESEGLGVKQQNEELQSTIEALEVEKADMVEKLSQAKQKGVLAVRDEEERKRKQLEATLEKKQEEYRIQCQKHFNEETKKLEEEWRKRFREHEEQMQLAIEEREMQNAAAGAEQERKIDELHSAVEQLTAEKLQLSLKLDGWKEKSQQEIQELNDRINKNAENYKTEIANLIKEHDEMIAAIKKDSEEAKSSRDFLKEELSNIKKNYEKNKVEIEKQHEAAVTALVDEKKAAEKSLKQREKECTKLKEELVEALKTKDALSSRLKKNENLLADLKKEQLMDDEEISSLRQQLEELTSNSTEQRKATDDEISQLKGILKENSDYTHQLESEKEALTVQLAAYQDSGKMHEELHDQLNAARCERDEAKKQLLILQERLDVTKRELSECIISSDVGEKANDFLDGREQVVEGKKDVVDGLEDEGSKFSSKLEAALAIKEDLEEKVHKMRDEFQILKEEKRKSDGERESLEKQLHSLTVEMEAKMKKYESVCKALDTSKAEMIRASKRESELTDKLHEQESAAKKLQQRLSYLESQTKSLSENLSAKQHEFKTVEKGLTNKIDELKIALSERADEIAAVLSQKDHFETVAEKARLEIETLEQKLASAKKSVELLQDEIASSKHKFEESTHDGLSKDDFAIKTCVDRFSQSFIDISTNLLNKMELLKDQECRIKNLAFKLQSDNTFGRQRILLKENCDQISQLKHFCDELKEDVLRKDTVINDLQKRIVDLLEVEKKKDLEIEDLRNSSNGLIQQAEILQRDMEAAKEDCLRLHQEVECVTNTKEALQQTIGAIGKQADGLSQKEAELRSCYDSMLNEYEARIVNAEKHLDELSLFQTENKQLHVELSHAREESQKTQKELERILSDVKESENSKINEIKSIKDAEIMKLRDDSAKEIMLLRTNVNERINECSRLRDEIASHEQDFAIKEKVSRDTVDELKTQLEVVEKEKSSMADTLKGVEHELRELFAANDEKNALIDSKVKEILELQKVTDETNEKLISLTEKTRRLEDENSRLLEEKDELELSTKEYEDRLEQLKIETKECAVKADLDRQRLMKEVQKEIKRLYEDLNERSKKLDEANTKIAELTSKLSSVKNIDASSVDLNNQNNADLCRIDNDDLSLDYEEVQSLKDQVQKYQKEIATLKAQQNSSCSRLEILAEENDSGGKQLPFYIREEESKDPLTLNFGDNMKASLQRACSKYSSDLSPNFADPAEAEYLRYVLYRYMSERENLGKESVTLVKVIATVAKFSREQLEIVVAKEEQRTNPLFRPIF